MLGTAGEAGDNSGAMIHILWILLAGFLVMFMQAGFAMVETGLTRSPNVSHTTAMSMTIYCIAVLSFFFCGFAILLGGQGLPSFAAATSLGSEFRISLFGKEFGIFGTQGFLLSGWRMDASLLALFVFHLALCSVAATIATGTLAERWKFSAFMIYGVVMTALIYPVSANWIWGGGWLSALGSNFGLGHGAVDFAGSAVVHVAGGAAAFAGCMILGPRLGKYTRTGSVNVLIAHNAPMYMLGTLILALGWFGFTTGHCALGADSGTWQANVARVAANTMLASASGAIAAMLYLWWLYKKPDPSFVCNGLLAGLVAISAPCAFVTPAAAVFIGAVAGVLVVCSVLFLERTAKLDDPVGAISVHGVSGIWGALAVGLFADGTYGLGWNHSHLFRIAGGGLKWLADRPQSLPAGWTEQGVTGLFYGNASQLVAQVIGVAATLAWAFVASCLLFWLVERLLGNRVSMAAELQGLDIAELGVLGYVHEDPQSPSHRSSSAHSNPAFMEPRPAAAPPAGKTQFGILVEGVDTNLLQAAWSALCQPSDTAPEPDFLAIYPQFTTLKGNRFRFCDGQPEEFRGRLQRLLQKRFPDQPLKSRVET